MENKDHMSNAILTSDIYISERIEKEILILRKSGRSYKYYYYIGKSAQILLLIILPLIILSINNGDFYYFDPRFAAIFASIGALSAELILSVFRFYELWFKFRESAKSLERELFLYKTKTGPYQFDSPTIFNDFVMMAERLMKD